MSDLDAIAELACTFRAKAEAYARSGDEAVRFRDWQAYMSARAMAETWMRAAELAEETYARACPPREVAATGEVST